MEKYFDDWEKGGKIQKWEDEIPEHLCETCTVQRRVGLILQWYDKYIVWQHDIATVPALQAQRTVTEPVFILWKVTREVRHSAAIVRQYIWKALKTKLMSQIDDGKRQLICGRCGRYNRALSQYQTVTRQTLGIDWYSSVHENHARGAQMRATEPLTWIPQLSARACMLLRAWVYACVSVCVRARQCLHVARSRRTSQSHRSMQLVGARDSTRVANW